MFIIRFSGDITAENISSHADEITQNGYEIHCIDPVENGHNIITPSRLPEKLVNRLAGIIDIQEINTPYILSSREYQPQNTVIKLENGQVGSGRLYIIAGPCAVESRAQYLECAHAVREAGGDALRGALFKPRTTPYSFQGMGDAGIEILMEARAQTGLPIFTEVLSVEQAHHLKSFVDVFQIGARNMQNFPLLREIGILGKPALLKRGMGNTVTELLSAAEYILYQGNKKLMLCERGIRSFENSTRFTFDLNAIPVLTDQTHLPIIADPSHATGNRNLVSRVGLGAVAAGVHGLLVEIHPHPELAKSDGPQSLRPEEFRNLVKTARAIQETIQNIPLMTA